MRAYLLGYNHGKNDGYHSTLIERGGCKKSYDESLDVEYVAVDEALEIIDTQLEALADGKYGGASALNYVYEAVLALRKKRGGMNRNDSKTV